MKLSISRFCLTLRRCYMNVNLFPLVLVSGTEVLPPVKLKADPSFPQLHSHRFCVRLNGIYSPFWYHHYLQFLRKKVPNPCRLPTCSDVPLALWTSLLLIWNGSENLQCNSYFHPLFLDLKACASRAGTSPDMRLCWSQAADPLTAHSAHMGRNLMLWITEISGLFVTDKYPM